jgi:hypothetical protein
MQAHPFDYRGVNFGWTIKGQKMAKQQAKAQQ